MSSLPELITFGLKVKIWEFEIGELLRLIILIYGVPQLFNLIKKRGKKMLNIIKRNKFTILGYLTVIIVDLAMLGITSITLRYPAVAEAIFGGIGLVVDGIVNETGIYSLVAGVLATITGTTSVAITKGGWESKEKYELRIESVKIEDTKKWFVDEVKKRFESYRTNYSNNVPYSVIFSSGILVTDAQLKYLNSIADELVDENKSNKILRELLSKELSRITTEKVTIDENIDSINW